MHLLIAYKFKKCYKQSNEIKIISFWSYTVSIVKKGIGCCGLYDRLLLELYDYYFIFESNDKSLL